MTDEQNVAYINSQVACALINMEAMKATNQICEANGEDPYHDESAFLALIEMYRIHYSEVLKWLQ